MCTSSYSSVLYRVSGTQSNLLASIYTLHCMQYIQEELFHTGKNLCGAFGAFFNTRTLCVRNEEEKKMLQGQDWEREKEGTKSYLLNECGFWWGITKMSRKQNWWNISESLPNQYCSKVTPITLSSSTLWSHGRKALIIPYHHIHGKKQRTGSTQKGWLKDSTLQDTLQLCLSVRSQSNNNNNKIIIRKSLIFSNYLM